MRYRYRSSASRDAAAEARAAELTAAGVPVRTDLPQRKPIALDLSGVGGRSLVLEQVRGRLTWRARDVDTGEVLHGAALKSLIRWAADRLPRTLSARSAGQC